MASYDLVELCLWFWIHVLDVLYYDIRKKCEGNLCYDFSNVETFLNEKTVRDDLGVGNLDFVSCSSTVYDAMMQDWMRNLEVGIPALLEDEIHGSCICWRRRSHMQLAWVHHQLLTMTKSWLMRLPRPTYFLLKGIYLNYPILLEQ
ncbi:hypothetical protein HN873_060427 [Arachis hypogaea]